MSFIHSLIRLIIFVSILILIIILHIIIIIPIYIFQYFYFYYYFTYHYYSYLSFHPFIITPPPPSRPDVWYKGSNTTMVMYENIHRALGQMRTNAQKSYNRGPRVGGLWWIG